MDCLELTHQQTPSKNWESGQYQTNLVVGPTKHQDLSLKTHDPINLYKIICLSFYFPSLTEVGMIYFLEH